MGREGEARKTAAGWLSRMVLAAVLLCTVVGWTGSIWWFGEVASCFWPVCAAVWGGGALMAWRRGWRRWALVWGGLALILLLAVVPGAPELERAAGVEGRAPVTVFCHNVNAANRQASEVLREVRAIAPDVAVFIEVDAWWAGRLEELEDSYPYNIVEARDGCFGLAIFSRRPLGESLIRDFSGYELPSLQVGFEVDGREVTLIGTHPPPPVGSMPFRIRNWHLAELARDARLREAPLIVVGDLNCTPWSAAFRRFAKASGLRSAGVSRAVTWSPVRCAWLGFPIDYQLASEEWTVVRRKTGSFLGSDHRWTMVEFQLAPERR